MMKFDEIDKAILRALQKNARISMIEIARKVGLAPSAALARVRKLERSGVITGYETRMNPKSFGLDLVTFIHVSTHENIGSLAIGRRIALIPGVQEVHSLAGKYCYLVKARVRNTAALSKLLERIGVIKGVSGSFTTLSLGAIKESIGVDLEAPDEE